MTKKIKPYNIEHFSPFRKATSDMLNAAKRKNMVHALIEMDITNLRNEIRTYRRENNKFLSLLGYLLFCTAKALNNYKNLQAYRDWRNRLVIFTDIDISTTIERKIKDEYVVIPKIIRNANQKDMFEISEEIKEAKTESVQEAEVFKSMKKYLAIPLLFRRMAFRFLDRFPSLMKKKAGTIMITSAAIGIKGNAWGIPIASHTLNITIGGINTINQIVNGQVTEREYLCLTISFDHDNVDGAPVSRFIRNYKKVIETGLIENVKTI